MKLQMQNDGLRVRIDEAELAALQAGEALTLTLGHALQPLFSLRATLDEDLFVQIGTCWQLALPRTAVADYVQTLPNRHALELSARANGHPLTIQFEVDVRDSLQVRGARRRVPDGTVPS